MKEKSVGDVKLSIEGIQQAKKTASYFENKKMKEIFSSPLRRAKEMAMYISDSTKISVREDIRLRERANWGGYTRTIL